MNRRQFIAAAAAVLTATALPILAPARPPELSITSPLPVSLGVRPGDWIQITFPGKLQPGGEWTSGYCDVRQIKEIGPNGELELKPL